MLAPPDPFSMLLHLVGHRLVPLDQWVPWSSNFGWASSDGGHQQEIRVGMCRQASIRLVPSLWDHLGSL